MKKEELEKKIKQIDTDVEINELKRQIILLWDAIDIMKQYLMEQK